MEEQGLDRKIHVKTLHWLIAIAISVIIIVLVIVAGYSLFGY